MSLEDTTLKIYNGRIKSKQVSEFVFSPGSLLKVAKKTANENNYGSFKKGITSAGNVAFYEIPRTIGLLYLSSEIGNQILQI